MSLIRIAEDDYHKCLKDIRLPNSKIRFFEEKIVALQRKLEDLLAEDDEIRHKASKGKHFFIYEHLALDVFKFDLKCARSVNNLLYVSTFLLFSLPHMITLFICPQSQLLWA